MSTATLEPTVDAALDLDLAAGLTADLVTVARTLFALALPGKPLSAGPGTAPYTPVDQVAPQSDEGRQSAPVSAAVPVAIPALPELSALPTVRALTVVPTPSALPVPPLEVPAPVPAEPAEDVVAIPANTPAPHSMAMLSEIGFLDD